MTLIDWIGYIMLATFAILALIGTVLIMCSKPQPDPEEATDASHSPLNGQYIDIDTREARIRAEWRGR